VEETANREAFAEMGRHIAIVDGLFVVGSWSGLGLFGVCGRNFARKNKTF
jgi:hypothetical protein